MACRRTRLAFYEMVRRYARAMRRIHQTMFYIELDEACVASRAPYTFDFEYLRPLIRLFFDEGMQKMELGALLSRGFLPDGMPDMYTDSFKCAMAPERPLIRRKAMRSQCALYRRWRNFCANMAGRTKWCSTFMTSQTSILKTKPHFSPESVSIISQRVFCVNTCPMCVSSKPSLRRNFAVVWIFGCPHAGL